MDLRPYIEHTRLKSDTTISDIETLCQEAKDHLFYGVCVPPYFVAPARKILGRKSNIKLVTVVGFPMGYHVYTAKVEEARKAMLDGADEIDMVINIAALKNQDFATVGNELDTLMTLTSFGGKILKAIIETPLLSTAEIVKAAQLCAEKKVHFVKTGTGMTGMAPDPETIRIIKNHIHSDMGIKASGGIKSYQQAYDLIRAGANRLGTSASIQIVQNETN